MVAEAKRIGTLEAKKTKGKKCGPKEKIKITHNGKSMGSGGGRCQRASY